MYSRIKLHHGVIVFSAVLAGMAVATAAEQDGPLGMRIGSGSRLILSLDSGVTFSDNAFYQNSNEDSIMGAIVKPAALWLTDRGSVRYQVGASAETGATDFEGDEDDYLDGLLKAEVEWKPLTKHLIKGGAYWATDHDPFGTRRTESAGTTSISLDEYEEYGGNAVYRFGAPEATLNLEGEVRVFDREYQTNRAVTRFLDHDTLAGRGTVYYRISPKTQILGEVLAAEIDYDHVQAGFASRAGDLLRYRIGARWLATAKTVGDVRVGKVERDFDSNIQDDYDEIDWQVILNWSPRTRDLFSLTGGREPEESYLNAASIIDNQFMRAAWKHDWTAHTASTLTASYNDLDFFEISRRDKIKGIGLEVLYSPTRRWTVFGELSYEERNSNFAGNARDYEVMQALTGIRLAY